jgi:HK97 family phage portal protein
MAWFNRWFQDRETKHSRFSTLFSYQAPGKPLYRSTNFSQQVANGYQNNPIVYRCISLIARSISSIPLILKKEEKQIETHPLLSLLKEPNPLQSYQSFCEAALSYLLLSGNSFIEAIHVGHTPTELYTLRPDRIELIPGPKGFPEGYEYTIGSVKQRIMIDPLSGASAILHMRLFNPLDDWYGMSPMMVAEHSISLQNTVLHHNLSLLKNDGRPSGALLVKNKHPLSESERLTLREELEEMYAGTKNSGRMMVLEGDLEWKEMGLSPKDMDFSEGKNLSARDIAQVFGVPPLCVGILGDATFSNYREAVQDLWSNTLIPLLDSFLSHLNRWLVPQFGPDLSLSYHKEGIDAIAQKRWECIERADCLTLNEKRALLGYPPLKDGDQLL